MSKTNYAYAFLHLLRTLKYTSENIKKKLKSIQNTDSMSEEEFQKEYKETLEFFQDTLNNVLDDFGYEIKVECSPNTKEETKINTNKENCNYTYKMKSNKTLRLTESQLHKIVKESVKKILKVSDNSEVFEYEPDERYNLYSAKSSEERWFIYFRNKFIGFKVYDCRERIKYKYLLPDVEIGLIDDQYFEFKYFDNYADAFNYTVKNFEDILYLLENGIAD